MSSAGQSVHKWIENSKDNVQQTVLSKPNTSDGPRVGPEVPPTLSQKGLEGQSLKIPNIHGTTFILIAPGPFSIYQHEITRISHCKQQWLL